MHKFNNIAINFAKSASSVKAANDRGIDMCIGHLQAMRHLCLSVMTCICDHVKTASLLVGYLRGTGIQPAYEAGAGKTARRLSSPSRQRGYAPSNWASGS